MSVKELKVMSRELRFYLGFEVLLGLKVLPEGLKLFPEGGRGGAFISVI